MNEFNKKSRDKRDVETAKKNKKIPNILSVLIVIIVLALLYQGYVIGSYYYDLWKSSQVSNIAQELFFKELEGLIYEPPEDADSAGTEIPYPSGALESEAPADTAKPEQSDPVEDKIKLSKGIDALKEEFGNSDITAYLYIKGTRINNTVVQGEDDSFYLTHDLYKRQNVNGTLFLDSSNSRDFTDRNNVIYGHNMRNGTMFHDLRYYRQKSYYDGHKYITLITETDAITWEIFSAYESTTDFNYLQTKFTDDIEFESYLEAVTEKSLYATGVSVTMDDTILTLSTCANTGDDMRFVVQAKLIERK